MGAKTGATGAAQATMATVRQSLMLAGITKLIEVLEAEARDLEAQGGLPSSTKSGGTRGAPAPAEGSTAPGGRSLEDLEVKIVRLRQLLDLLREDPRLLPLADEYIGQQVQAMETRQNWRNLTLAVVTTVTGALLGWLSSLLGTPVALFHLVGH